ncbi:MAG: hypothetical protein ACRC2T_13515, partial [Thermoguttaceae bacterium]
MKNLFKIGCVYALAGILSVAAFFPKTTYAAEQKQFLTVSVSSYVEILNSAKKIAELVGQGDQFSMFQSMFGQLPGSDNTKPLGFALFSDDETFVPMLFLPITDITKFEEGVPNVTEMLENFEKVADGKYQLETPYGNYLLEQRKNWVVFFPEDNADLLPEDPTKLLGGLDKKYALSIKIDFENAPQDLLNGYIAMAEMIVAMQNPEAAEQFSAVKEQINVLFEQCKWLVEGVAIDPNSGDVSFEIDSEVKAGTDIAKLYSEIKNAKSNFGGFFYPKQAASCIGVGFLPEYQKEANRIMINGWFEGYKEQLENELEEDDLEIATSFLDSINELTIAAIDDGKMDGAFTWFSTGEFFAATRVAKGEKVYELLEKAAKLLEKEDPSFAKENVKLGFATFEGYKLSSVVAPLALIPNIDQMPGDFADKSLCLLIGTKDDAFCFALGTNLDKQQTALKKAITDSKTPVSVPETMFVFSIPQTAKALRAIGVNNVS